MNSMDFASKGLYTSTNNNRNGEHYQFIRESVVNSDKNLIGTPRNTIKVNKTTMYDPNHLNKFIKESNFANSPSRAKHIVPHN